MPQIYNDNIGEVLRNINGDYGPNGGGGGGGGGNGIAGGGNTQLQYNNNGAFGGVPTTSFNNSSNTLNLGNSYNLAIGDGAPGQYLSTSGSGGTLVWANIVGNVAQPFIRFTVNSNSNNQTFTDSRLATFSTESYMNVTKDGVILEPSIDFTKINNTTIRVNPYLTIGSTIDVLATGQTIGGGGGGVTQILAGQNISVSPTSGTGVVTISSTGNLTAIQNGNTSISIPVSNGPFYANFRGNTHFTMIPFSGSTTTGNLPIMSPILAIGNWKGEAQSQNSNASIVAITSRGTRTNPQPLQVGDYVSLVGGSAYSGNGNVTINGISGYTDLGNIVDCAVTGLPSAPGASYQTKLSFYAKSGIPQTSGPYVGQSTETGFVINGNRADPYANLYYGNPDGTTQGANLYIGNLGLDGNNISLGNNTNVTRNIFLNSGTNPSFIAPGGPDANSYIQVDTSNISIKNLNLSVPGSRANLGNIGNISIGGGTNGQYLQTDGSGNLSWTTGSGGNGTPGGSNTQVQFNNDGVFGGSSALTFNNTTNTLTSANLNVTGRANLGSVGNLTITGGSSGQVLTTDGSGGVTWANANATSGTANYIIETVNIITNSTGVYTFDIIPSSIKYARAAATANITLNLRGNATTTLNSLLSFGQSITSTYVMTTGSTAYGVTDVQIDGVAQTIKWANEGIPVFVANAIESFTITTIITSVTPTPAYTVLGSMTWYGS